MLSIKRAARRAALVYPQRGSYRFFLAAFFLVTFFLVTFFLAAFFLAFFLAAMVPSSDG